MTKLNALYTSPATFFLTGLSAFPLTPTDANGRMDIGLFTRLVSRLSEAGVGSIGVLGSTGTYMYLSRNERRRIIEAAVKTTAGRTPVIAGIGALRTDDTVKLAQDTISAGATAGLLAPVSYTPLTQDEVFSHFATVAKESALPIIIYDNPATTHFTFTPDLVARLSAVPGIIAIKNPTRDRASTLAHLAAQRQAVPTGFSVGYSADWNCTEAMIAGADVWYSVLAGLMPRPCMEIVSAARRGDFDEARRIDALLEPLWALFQKYSSLRVSYALAALIDLCHAAPPLPIHPLSVAAIKELHTVVENLPADFTL